MVQGGGGGGVEPGGGLGKGSSATDGAALQAVAVESGAVCFTMALADCDTDDVGGGAHMWRSGAVSTLTGRPIAGSTLQSAWPRCRCPQPPLTIDSTADMMDPQLFATRAPCWCPPLHVTPRTRRQLLGFWVRSMYK